VLTIQSNDEKDAPLDEGGLEFSIQLESNALLYKLAPVDHGDGSYGCSYKVCSPGEYELSILLNDE